nr:DMT family transporter [Convivina sp. LMG 32447]
MCIKGFIYGVLSATLFGVSGVLASFLFQSTTINPEWLVGTRMFWSGFILLIILFMKNGWQIFEMFTNIRAVVSALLFGILGVLLAQSSFFLSVYYGDAATATVLQSLGPTIIIIILSVISRTLPSRIDVIVLILALLGVVLLATNGQFSTLAIGNQALFWGILSAFGLAGYTLLPRPLLKNYSPLLVAAWGLFIGGVVVNFFQPIWHSPQQLVQLDWIFILIIIIGGTLLPYAFYVMSLCHLKANYASLLGTIEPLVATVLSVIFLNTKLALVQVIGIILILSTIVLMSIPRRYLGKKE